MSFHSRQSFSASFFHVSLGLPVPRLSSICISHDAVLTAPLERSICTNQRSFLSLNEIKVLVYHNLENSTCDPLKYAMSRPVPCLLYQIHVWENPPPGVKNCPLTSPLCIHVLAYWKNIPIVELSSTFLLLLLRLSNSTSLQFGSHVGTWS